MALWVSVSSEDAFGGIITNGQQSTSQCESEKNLFLREFPAKNRKVRLKGNTEVPWKNCTKEVPMASDSSNAGMKENFPLTTQLARLIS